jgi:hypothetical protein
MIEYNSKQVLGKKDLIVTLQPGKSSTSTDPSTSSQENFKQFSDTPATASEYGAIQTQHSLESISRTGFQPNNGPNYIAIVVAVICIIALMLPSTEEKSNSYWSILQLSSHQKMVFAYSLGLVTMVIFRA